MFADIIEDHAARRPDRPALLSDTETFSYAALAQRINRYARWALSAGIKPGDTVCLFMPSRPDYVAAWLGITKVGGVAALINTKLVGLSLSHCINVAEADIVVLSADLADVFETVAAVFVPDTEYLVPWRPRRAPISTIPVRRSTISWIGWTVAHSTPPSGGAVSISDRALLIYTSGTTGRPKAARVSHHAS